MAYVFVYRTRVRRNGNRTVDRTCICGNMRLCESRMQLPNGICAPRFFLLAARAPLSCHWHLCPKRKTRPRPERHNTVAATPLARVFASKHFLNPA